VFAWGAATINVPPPTGQAARSIHRNMAADRATRFTSGPAPEPPARSGGGTLLLRTSRRLAGTKDPAGPADRVSELLMSLSSN